MTDVSCPPISQFPRPRGVESTSLGENDKEGAMEHLGERGHAASGRGGIGCMCGLGLSQLSGSKKRWPRTAPPAEDERGGLRAFLAGA